MYQAYFTNFSNRSNWVRGKIGEYTFDAKLFNIDSMYGIEGGRVSKLSIYCGSSIKDHICNYDRGWDITTRNKEEEMIFDAVMDLLENSEERDLD